jgi:hypothetical protein
MPLPSGDTFPAMSLTTADSVVHDVPAELAGH